MEAIAEQPSQQKQVSKNPQDDAKTTWKKAPCRYGRGCTHIGDESHCARFWHPPAPEPTELSPRSLRYIVCNECGFECQDSRDMQLHLQRKTAWSNRSLVGCHVSVLLDNRDWQDGIVTQFIKSGRHCVEFRLSDHKRWLNMSKAAFFIVERPVIQAPETKEACEDSSLAPVEKWNFVEEISLDFVGAQSLIHRIYGNKIHETGHRTMGHLCISDDDKTLAKKTNSSMLYGELLPRGLNRALDRSHLDAENGETLFDLGMGTGKVVLQAFVQFPNLKRVYGVELSASRFQVAEQAVRKLIDLSAVGRYEIVSFTHQRELTLREKTRKKPSSSSTAEEGGVDYRYLQLECKNLFEVTHLHTADFVLLETDIPTESMLDLACLLYKMKRGARVLSYLDFRKLWDPPALPFVQPESNRSLADRFPTSWSVQRGHHFFIWIKICGPVFDAARFYSCRKAVSSTNESSSRMARVASSRRDEENTLRQQHQPQRKGPVPALSLPARHRSQSTSWSLLAACSGFFTRPSSRVTEPPPPSSSSNRSQRDTTTVPSLPPSDGKGEDNEAPDGRPQSPPSTPPTHGPPASPLDPLPDLPTGMGESSTQPATSVVPRTQEDAAPANSKEIPHRRSRTACPVM